MKKHRHRNRPNTPEEGARVWLALEATVERQARARRMARNTFGRRFRAALAAVLALLVFVSR